MWRRSHRPSHTVVTNPRKAAALFVGARVPSLAECDDQRSTLSLQESTAIRSSIYHLQRLRANLCSGCNRKSAFNTSRAFSFSFSSK